MEDCVDCVACGIGDGSGGGVALLVVEESGFVGFLVG